MNILVLVITGLAFGSFVNALTWRVYKQSDAKKTRTKIKNHKVDLSIVSGRSVCVHCGHELAVKDLVPVLSWVWLRGKCRYCEKPIEDSPVVEAMTAGLFLISYLHWQYPLVDAGDWVIFVLWLAVVVGLVALAVYDLRHYLLPNRILFPLMGVALALRGVSFVVFDQELGDEIVSLLGGLLVGGGVFYGLFQISDGKWIGGGDVKLGFLIGILLAPKDALIALLSAFYIAAILILPLMITKRVSRKSKIPFGPFLIVGLIIAMLWSNNIQEFYTKIFEL